MNFLYEKQTRHFFINLIALSILLLGVGIFLCFWQTQSVKEIMLTHDANMVDSLLQQNVPSHVIAVAISSNIDEGKGRELLSQLGYTPKTADRFLPTLSTFKIATGQTIFIILLSFIALLFSICCTYLTQREKLYNQAFQIILAYSAGDFSKNLPSSNEGTLYQLFSSIDKLASALQAKGEAENKAKEYLKNTISDISHQLKTPLSALSMYNEIILDETNNPNIVREFSLKTTTALGRIEQLIQSLLKITRLDARSITFQKSSYLITEVVEKSIENLTTRALFENKQILLNGEPSELLTCDLQWTSEALGNIVKNALDHTMIGGHITISWTKSLSMTQIQVTDDGTGIAPEDIHHIFKRFYQSKKANTTQGIGLGLSLAKSIVEGQGGTVSVQSILGRGTTFTLSFLTEM